MLHNVKRTKLRELLADHLQSHIARESLKPGDRLPTESALAAQFGVSRLSLREATKSLEYLGIVEAKPGRGLTVGRVDLDRVTECIGFHPALLDADPRTLVDTRVVIETGILEHVARRMQDDATIYETLNQINAELRGADTVERWVALDIAFHRSLLEASGLAPLLAFADVLSVFFRRFRESVKKAEWSGGIASHQQIIDALRAGDVGTASAQLREHIESHMRRGVAKS